MSQPQYPGQPQPPNNPYQHPTQPQYPPQDYQQPGQPQPPGGYPPPPGQPYYQAPNYYQPQYQRPPEPPRPDGFPAWAWLAIAGILGLTVVAIIFIILNAGSSDTNKNVTSLSLASTPAGTAGSATTGATTTQSATTGAATTGATARSNSATPPATTKSPATTAPALTTPAATTPASGSTVDSTWTTYNPANAGFSIALPPGWQQVDEQTAKTFVDEGFKAIKDQNPQLAASLESQVKTLFSSGLIKFFAFDTTFGSFATNVNIARQSVPANVTLDQYVQVNLDQVGKIVKFTKPLTHSRVKLPAGEAEEISYEWNITQGGSQAVNVTTLQYIIFNKDHAAYVLTFTTMTEQSDANRPLFKKIVESIQFS